MSAGRVLYESDGDSQLNLTQSGFYNGTGLDSSLSPTNGEMRQTAAVDQFNTSGKPFNIYSINYGLQASRLENTGSLSLQNLNNPVLRIYFKPDTWAEFNSQTHAGGPNTDSDALTAAKLGVQVDVIHEFYNVVTINSGNGEITSGLNQ